MLDKITNILRAYKSDESLVVSENTTFEELGLDSLDIVQLIMEIEDTFNITIEMDKSMKDIAALIAVIEKVD